MEDKVMVKSGYCAFTHPAYIGNGYYRCNCGVESKGIEEHYRHVLSCTKISPKDVIEILSAKQYQKWLKDIEEDN
jgi:hypothetical protein